MSATTVSIFKTKFKTFLSCLMILQDQSSKFKLFFIFIICCYSLISPAEETTSWGFPEQTPYFEMSVHCWQTNTNISLTIEKIVHCVVHCFAFSLGNWWDELRPRRHCSSPEISNSQALFPLSGWLISFFCHVWLSADYVLVSLFATCFTDHLWPTKAHEDHLKPVTVKRLKKIGIV